MTRKLTFHEGGRTIELEMSPEFWAGADKIANWDGWCRCDVPEAGDAVPRGHSVDVPCRKCGGWLQIG